MKNTDLIRNFIIFAVILSVCVGALGYHTFKSSEDIKLTDQWVSHSQKIIVQAQKLQVGVMQSISSERNFIQTKEETALKAYQEAKSALSDQVAELRELTQDNIVQSSRANELEHLSLKLKDVLDAKVQKFKLIPGDPTISEMNDVVAIRDNVLRVINDVLTEEHKVLYHREKIVTNKIDNYQIGIFIGSVVVALMILIFNWHLLQAQSKVSLAEASLKESEERMRLAIRGSNDGIFDWNFKTHQIYWSPQYKAMLGYLEDEIKGNEDTFKQLLHPDDQNYFWESFNNYINGRLTEFSCIYRMMNKAGKPVWIHGRGKALFDENGQPYRFIGAHTDISYIKEHEAQMQEERDRAERASRAKGEFLAHMSHEIRTPLTAISGIAEIMNHESFKVEEQNKKLVRTLKTSTESLKELITDILDFSKIESGEIELHSQQFILGDMFQQVISIMSVKANEKMLDFHFDMGNARNASFFGDKQRIRQILINLLGNAIKFTESGHVHVNAVIEPVDNSHVLKISIKDSGIGIPENARALIFEKFRQADSSVSRRYGGTGLGLPISQSLAEIMGGTIKVESEVGIGSTFTVILPFASASVLPELDMDEVVQLEKMNVRLRGLTGPGKKILIVEDYEGNIVVLGYILQSFGCPYDVAKTGLEAVQAWKASKYDMILMDVQMPEMDGLTATRTIRKMEGEQGRSRTPIIGLTAHALVADKQKCIDSGMDDYLSKPIVESDLKAAILGLLDPGEQPSATTFQAKKA